VGKLRGKTFRNGKQSKELKNMSVLGVGWPRVEVQGKKTTTGSAWVKTGFRKGREAEKNRRSGDEKKAGDGGKNQGEAKKQQTLTRPHSG